MTIGAAIKAATDDDVLRVGLSAGLASRSTIVRTTPTTRATVPMPSAWAR